MKALVLAAGKSTRIASVSQGLPKPLIRVGGETILGRTLWWLAESDVREIWINLHYRQEEIRAEIGDGKRFGVAVRYSEEDPILGTAGAARKLSGEWDGTFVVVYGDNLVRFNIGHLVITHRHLGAAVTLALFDPKVHAHTGMAGGRVEVTPDGFVRRFVEGAAGEGGGLSLVNAGVYAVEPWVLERVPPGIFADFGRDFFPMLLGEGVRLGGHLIDGYCLGVDTPGSLARALALVEAEEVQLR